MKNKNEVELTIHLITGKTIVLITTYTKAEKFYNNWIDSKINSSNDTQEHTTPKIKFVTETNSIISVSIGVE